MKQSLSLLFAAILVSVSLSATNVSGLISLNTTWNLSGSPYVVTGNILVAENVTLTIDPGVVVRFDPSKSIQVNGTLVAKGSESDSIIFSSNTTQASGAWGNLYFTDSSADAVIDGNGSYISGSILEYCSFDYGGKIEADEVPMVRVSNAKPLVRHSSFRDAQISGIDYYDLTSFTDSCFFDYNSFRYCNPGFQVTSYGKVEIRHSSFILNQCGINGFGFVLVSNNIFTQNSHAINLHGEGAVVSENKFSDNKSTQIGGGNENSIISLQGGVHFINNLCENNHSSLLYHEPWNPCILTANIFSGNVSDSGSGWLILIDSFNTGCGRFDFTSNIITDNAGLKPVTIWLSATILNFSSNTISNNFLFGDLLEAINWRAGSGDTISLYLTNNVITRNTTSFNHLTSYRGNIILKNNSQYHNGGQYMLKNLNAPDWQPYLNVSNNYWGLSTLQELSTAIYDFFDDATLGITTFDTILLAPATSGPVSGLPHWNKRWHSAYTLFFPITACGSK